jgi:uncharacterized integral membrane protein (TIGR00698 family)
VTGALRRLAPGLAVLLAGALAARVVAAVTGVSHLLVAVGLGAALANTAGIPDRAEPGLATGTLWLGAGIVLMGASVRLGTVAAAGLRVLVVVAVALTTAVVVVELLSRRVFGLGDRLGSLLAAGAGVCGVSAVVAVAGAVRAREEQIAYAAATVLLFDALTLVAFPVLGDLLGLSDVVFGVWAGVSMFSTGPVVAAGFAHSPTAGQWATVAKLSRNALIGVVVLGYASVYATGGESDGPTLRTLWDEFPKFVLGFLALAVVASAGLFAPAQRTAIEHGYDWLFLLAFVALGTEIRLADLRDTGVRPALAVLAALVAASTVSLALLTVLF